jgi:polysaccharide pyruvyl transferase CsaB
MRIVISGYYGFGNAGDEAVLSAILAAFRERLPAARITVLSANPTSTRRTHNVSAVPRTGLRLLGTLGGADLFVSGGGSLFQDVTSARSALYYLGLLALAVVLSRRTMVYAQGIGPLRRGWIRRFARAVLDRTDLITVRDDDSLRRLRELGVRATAHVVADPVFALDPAPDVHIRELLGPRSAPRIGVAMRPWADNAYAEALIEALRAVRERTGAQIVVFAFHPARDMAICRAAADVLAARVVADLHPREMLAAVATLDLLVGVRLHALIAAIRAGVPAVGVSYDPKVDGLFRRIGIGQLVSMEGLQAGSMQQAILSVWQSRAEIRAQLLALVPVLRGEALRAADLARAVLPAA